MRFRQLLVDRDSLERWPRRQAEPRSPRQRKSRWADVASFERVHHIRATDVVGFQRLATSARHARPKVSAHGNHRIPASAPKEVFQRQPMAHFVYPVGTKVELVGRWGITSIVP